jgi:sugar-specific transcriptional regulator TrmB
MKENFLKSVGFSDREYMIYYTLVTSGGLTITELAKKVHIHRPYVYKTLRELITKGVVFEHGQARKKTYTAVSPRVCKNLLEERIEGVSASLNALEEEYKDEQGGVTITSFEGRKGITAMFDDVVTTQKKGDVFFRYTSEKDTEYVNTFLSPNYRRIRDAKHLERFVIANTTSAKTKKNRLERAMKVLNEKESPFASNCIQTIYGNKIAFINIAKKRGFVIEDADLAQFQKEIFKALYKRI